MTGGVVVTGATSGIGDALVRALSEKGRPVLAVGRREDRLEQLAAETGCDSVAADVRDLGVLGPRIGSFEPDVLVNNAGVGHGITGLGDVDMSAIEEAVAINVAAVIQLTSLALEGMRTRGRGHIVNVGSISGLHTIGSALYGATKAAVHMFSQNLRNELAGTGIRVTEIAPGRVASEFHLGAAGDRATLGRIADSGMRELQPEDIAQAVLFALDVPPHVDITTIELLPTDQAVGGVVNTRQERSS